MVRKKIFLALINANGFPFRPDTDPLKHARPPLSTTPYYDWARVISPQSQLRGPQYNLGHKRITLQTTQKREPLTLHSYSHTAGRPPRAVSGAAKILTLFCLRQTHNTIAAMTISSTTPNPTQPMMM